MKIKFTIGLLCCTALLGRGKVQAQEFYLYDGPMVFDTHVPNATVEKNTFLKKEPDYTQPPVYGDIQSKLPRAIWPARPDVISCYNFAWRTAFKNLHAPTKANGFVSPFIDTAFNGSIFMWDSSFMLMFGRYGTNAFNFQTTLDNFYCKQHIDGFICREIKQSDGTDSFERFDPSSTGPNIMPWAEWEYFLNFNDKDRLSRVFDPLLAYYQWYQIYRTWPDGSYFSSGWGTGVDNQPRVPKEFNQGWSHAHMSWVDVTLQEIFAGKILIKMAECLNRTDDVKDIEKNVAHLTKYVNEKMWNEETQFYSDRWKDGTVTNVKSIVAYWALLAEVVNNKRIDPFVTHLENKNEFDRPNRIPALSADNPEYKPDGGYWSGGVWAPTTYMVLRGLTQYNKDSLAHEIALNNLNRTVSIFNETGTLFEHYAPELPIGKGVKNFVGWTGVIPITMLFEYVFGIRPNVPDNILTWDIRLLDEHGIENYPFGTNGILNLYCAKRKKLTDVPKVKITSNTDLKIKLIWDGGSKIIDYKTNNK